MGVKSTKYLTREDAEWKLVQFMFDGFEPKERIRLTNRELEDFQDILNDSRHEGEGFENYWIDESA